MEGIELLSKRSISSENLKILYNELLTITSSGDISKHEDECTTLIETIIEYLLHGDKADPSIFNIFYTNNFMSEFIYLSKASNSTINLQIIKSFGLLISNLTNKESIYLIFSNNFINDIISIPYEKSDSDFLSYYVNFIKSLSLKIDQVTIHLFFQIQINRFPLLDNALKLYNHPDSMISNVVRNIFLTIIKTKSPPVIEYVCSLPTISYFIFISCRVRDLILKINNSLLPLNLEAIKTLYEDIVNDVMFFQDIFSLKIDKITYILTNCLFHNIIFPLLCGSLIPAQKQTISIYISMNILIIFSFYIHDEHFLNLLFGSLFSKQINSKVVNKVSEEPVYPPNYNFEWNIDENKETKLSSFNQYITYNLSEKFVNSIAYMSNSKYHQIQDIVAKLTNIFENPNSNLQPNSLELHQIILGDLDKCLTIDQNKEMIFYHNIVSINTGISCGLNSKEYEDSATQQMDQFWKEIYSSSASSYSVKNPIRENLLNHFNSKDDSIVLLTGLLMNILIKKNNIISKELLSMTQLLPAHYFIENINVVNQSKENNLFIDINSIDSNAYTHLYENYDIDVSQNTQPVGEINYSENNQNIESLSLSSYYSYFQKKGASSVIILDSGYFNSKFQMDQNVYDKSLINSLLKLFENEPLFRPLTLRIIVNTIELLIIKGLDVSIIHKDESNRIKKAYITSIMDITSFLEKYDIIKTECYSLFEKEWKRYHIDLFKTVDDLLKEPYFLFSIPDPDENNFKNYPSILANSNQITDIFSTHLLIFMAFHDLRSKMCLDDKNIQSEFPLSFTSNQFELNKKYHRNSIKINFLNGKIKKGQNGAYIDYSMFISQNYLIVMNQDIRDKELFVVKQKYPIRHFKTKINLKEQNKLFITTGEEGVNIEIIFILDNKEVVKKVKESLEFHCQSVESEEFILIHSYFSEQINQFEKYN